MPYTIDVQSTQRYPTALMQAVARAAHRALVQESADENASLTILLTDDDYLQQLNRDYRGEDLPTDVLSFPAGEPLPGMEETVAYLGDVAISVPFAERQATAKGHDTPAELSLLAVHGVLHLLGYDHLDSAGRLSMWARQAAILEQLGLGAIQPSEDDHESG